MRAIILLALVMVLGTGCSSVKMGYILENVAMDQPRIASCSTYKIETGTAEEMMENCGNWLGCTHFETDTKPAVVYYQEGHQEILIHELDHCIAGGPLHESDFVI